MNHCSDPDLEHKIPAYHEKLFFLKPCSCWNHSLSNSLEENLVRNDLDKSELSIECI